MERIIGQLPSERITREFALFASLWFLDHCFRPRERRNRMACNFLHVELVLSHESMVRARLLLRAVVQKADLSLLASLTNSETVEVLLEEILDLHDKQKV